MNRKIRRILASAYFSTGLLIVLCTQLFGCVGTKEVSTSNIDINQITQKEQALEWYKQELLTVNLEGLSEEQSLPAEQRNERLIAEQYFNICQNSDVYFHCVQSTDRFAQLSKDNPDDWLVRAYLGSSYALKARNYPIQGLWQVIPGPGFVRLYNVNRAASHLNAAVEAEPKDPIIRLIRASTFVSMPFTKKKGRKDMKLLLSWVEDPSLNPENADMLTSKTYTNEVFYEYVTHETAGGDVLAESEKLQLWNAIAGSDVPGHPMIKLAEIYAGTNL